jgi:hypothetical protein
LQRGIDFARQRTHHNQSARTSMGIKQCPPARGFPIHSNCNPIASGGVYPRRDEPGGSIPLISNQFRQSQPCQTQKLRQFASLEPTVSKNKASNYLALALRAVTLKESLGWVSTIDLLIEGGLKCRTIDSFDF